jgi:surfeit locus 1 family protein
MNAACAYRTANPMGNPRWIFRPKLAVTLAALLAVGVTLALGQWQHGRAQQKLALAAELDSRGTQPPLALDGSALDPRAAEFRRVVVRGTYDGSRTVLLDNKVLKGVAGYHVITPLKISGAERHVLVDRGWVAAGPRRDLPPTVATPAGAQTVEGIASVPSGRFLELGPDASAGPVRQNIVIGRLESELRIELLPVMVLQTNEAPDGLARVWERPDAGVDKHRVYSLQWYSLAALAAVLYVVLNLRRVR